MTRKMALLRAIELTKDEKDVNEKLIEILEDLYSSRWSEKKVYDSINQFILENDNVFPGIRDLGKGILPTNSVMEKIFKTRSLVEIHDKYFPESVMHVFAQNRKSDKYYTDIFIKTYMNISNILGKKYITQEEYDKHRGDSPSIRFIMKRLGYVKYREFINTYIPKKHTVVTTRFKSIEEIDKSELKIMLDKLTKILK